MKQTIHLPLSILPKAYLLLALVCSCCHTANAQTPERRLETSEVETKNEFRAQYMPKLHGILRGKYEYQPEEDASRFEVRNARLSVNGKMTLSTTMKGCKREICAYIGIQTRGGPLRRIVDKDEGCLGAHPAFPLPTPYPRSAAFAFQHRCPP